MPDVFIHANPEIRIRAFLEVVAFAEGATYDILFGGKKFTDFSRHPDIVVPFGQTFSTAAGRYQFLTTTWEEAALACNLQDFSPASQDRAAIWLLETRGVAPHLLNCEFALATYKAAPIWASLPDRDGNSFYGQPVKKLEELKLIYLQALATL